MGRDREEKHETKGEKGNPNQIFHTTPSSSNITSSDWPIACNAPTASADPNSSSVGRPSLIIGTSSVSFTFSLSCNFVEKILASLLLNSWNLHFVWENWVSVSFLGLCRGLTFQGATLQSILPRRRRPSLCLSRRVPFRVAYSSF